MIAIKRKKSKQIEREKKERNSSEGKKESVKKEERVVRKDGLV